MGFRFANVAGRSSLVDDAGDYYDLERMTDGAVSSDPDVVLADSDVLTAAQGRLDDMTPFGTLDGADISATGDASERVRRRLELCRSRR